MKKGIILFITMITLLCFTHVPSYAEEIDTPPGDPLKPEYAEVHVTGTTYGPSVTLYVTDASITVRPKFTAGTIRYDSATNVYNYDVGVYATITGFSSEVYTTSQIHAQLISINYYFNSSFTTLYVSYKVKVWAGSATNYTTSSQYTVTLPFTFF